MFSEVSIVLDHVGRFCDNSVSLSEKDTRRLAIIVDGVIEMSLAKIQDHISRAPTAPAMAMYTSDGWSATITTHQRILMEPHVRVDRKGRLRVEFGLERMFFRQQRPSGGEAVCLLPGVLRPMSKGRRSGNFFRAACDFVKTLWELGCRGIRIQLYCLDGLHAAAFLRLMRGRHALVTATPDVFETAADRLDYYVHDWVLGLRCRSHGCSNSIVWALKPWSSEEINKSAHVAVESLTKTASELRDKIPEFVGSRVHVGEQVYSDEDIREFWIFSWSSLRC